MKKPGPVNEVCEIDPASGLDPIPDHLGNPALVKWGDAEVGDNVNLKVPFVSKNVEYVRGYSPADEDGEGGTDRWIEKETWTLTGQIIDCTSLDSIFEAQQKLREIFAQDWQTLTVGSGDEELEKLYFGQLRSISFGESQYVQDIPYEVVIEGYRNASELPEEKRVINPVASYTWTEADDASVELRYEVSAQGIVTDEEENNALENAKKFVSDYLSDQNRMFKAEAEDFQPYIISFNEDYNGKRYLVSDEEKIDRVSASYGVIRVYRFDQTQGQYSSILRYTSDSNFTFGEVKELTFNGSVEIGYKGDIDADVEIDNEENLKELRERYENFKNENLIDPDNGDILYRKNIIREKVDEDILAGVLNFTLVFGSPEACIDDYDVTVEESAESSLIRVTVSGQARYRGPCDFDTLKECFYGTDEITCKSRVAIVQSHCYDLAYEAYRDFLKDNKEVENGDNVVNRFPLSISVTEDPTNKTINYTASFNDRLSYGAQSFDYTLSINPPIQQVIINSFQEVCTDNTEGDRQSCSGPARSHHYQDLGIGKAGTAAGKLTIVGSATEDGGSYIKTRILESIGGTSKIIATKKTQGGNQTDLNCVDGEGYQTHDLAWLYQKKGSASVVNSNSSDRTKIINLHGGSN